MKNTTIHISNLKLERYVLGELPEHEKKELDTLIKKDMSLAARYKAILASNKEILSLYSSEDMAIKINWKASKEKDVTRQRKKRFAIRTFSFAGAFLSLFALFFIFLPHNSVIRTKGNKAAIKIFRKTESGAELLSSGASVNRDDNFQIKYIAAGQMYGVIFSIDGNGEVTLHFPRKKDGSILLEQDGEIALFESFKLDNAPGFERFFFVTSKKRFHTDDILKAGYLLAKDSELAETGSLVLPKRFNQESFILLKEENQ